MGDGDTYYWAGGKRIPLKASGEVAVDLGSSLLTQAELEDLRATGRGLSGSLVIVSKDDVPGSLREGDAFVAGVHPVFRAEDGALIVVLPEVRVEARDPQRLAAVGRSLKSAHIKEQTEERLVLEPASGRGEDALRLANALAESPDTEVSQARFIRVVPRPGARR